MIWAFFVFGSVWFWTIFIIEFIVLTALVEHEDSGWSLGSVLIFIGLIHLFGDANAFVWMQDHPWDVVRWIVLYAVFGIAWGISKFYLHNTKVTRHLEKLKIQFHEWYNDGIASKTWAEKTFRLKPQDDERTLQQVHADWDPELGKIESWKLYSYRHLDIRERAWLEFGEQTSTVIFWMCYWPVSAFWTILNDPLRRAWKWAYHTFLVRIFEKIHAKTVGKGMEL